MTKSLSAKPEPSKSKTVEVKRLRQAGRTLQTLYITKPVERWEGASPVVEGAVLAKGSWR